MTPDNQKTSGDVLKQKGPYIITDGELIEIGNLIECDRSCGIADVINRDPYSHPLSEEIRKAREDVLEELLQVINEYVKNTWNSNVELSDLRNWIQLTNEKYDAPISERGYTSIYAGTRMFKSVKSRSGDKS
jgi:hypothetical protein